MLKILHYFSYTIAFLLFMGTAAFADAYEAVTLPFGIDNKEWEIGWQNKTDKLYMLEFIPKGQKVEDWKELVTLQFYPNLQNCSAEDFMNDFLSRLQKDEPSIQVKPISNSADNSVVEWNVLNSKKNTDQYELDRVMKGKKGLHMIHYAVKTSQWTDSERTKWLDFLDKAKISKAD